ncbi:MAG: hypothetical protein WC955_07220 [Elusimicrobiota bacterium]
MAGVTTDVVVRRKTRVAANLGVTVNKLRRDVLRHLPMPLFVSAFSGRGVVAVRAGQYAQDDAPGLCAYCQSYKITKLFYNYLLDKICDLRYSYIKTVRN